MILTGRVLFCKLDAERTVTTIVPGIGRGFRTKSMLVIFSSSIASMK